MGILLVYRNNEKVEEPKEKRQRTEVEFNPYIKCEIIKQESLRQPQRSSDEASSRSYEIPASSPVES